jgi:hypothetical protein
LLKIQNLQIKSLPILIRLKEHTFDHSDIYACK